MDLPPVHKHITRLNTILGGDCSQLRWGCAWSCNTQRNAVLPFLQEAGTCNGYMETQSIVVLKLVV